MKTLAFALLVAGAARAQDKPEEKQAETKAAVELTDAEAATLGGYVADQLDANPGADELERSIVGKVDEIQKARNASPEKKDDAAPAKGKGKKKSKKAGKKPSGASGDVIKNGLTQSDRQAFGKFVLSEINADLKGQSLADAVKKELARIREERVKSSSTADSGKKKKKKKGNG